MQQLGHPDSAAAFKPSQPSTSTGCVLMTLQGEDTKIQYATLFVKAGMKQCMPALA